MANKQLIAVCISDIHFNVKNLELCTKALESAIHTATELNVPLIIAGDLHDTKSIIHAEVSNRLIEIFNRAQCEVYIIVGNHDLISEKDSLHSLNYLAPYVSLINEGAKVINNILLVNYQTLRSDFESILSNHQKSYPDVKIAIVHQGFVGAYMGEYIQDKTSTSLETVKDLTVISGHYHKHQTVGTVTYIGSPFTMSFGEANDGDKGYLVLFSDGSFERKILNLRRHKIFDFAVRDGALVFSGDIQTLPSTKEDLIWVRIHGPTSGLDAVTKEIVANSLKLEEFKFDKIYEDLSSEEIKAIQDYDKKEDELLDELIDLSADTREQKDYLKQLYRDVM